MLPDNAIFGTSAKREARWSATCSLRTRRTDHRFKCGWSANVLANHPSNLVTGLMRVSRTLHDSDGGLKGRILEIPQRCIVFRGDGASRVEPLGLDHGQAHDSEASADEGLPVERA